MANTKIPVELSSTPGIVDNSNATAITIDSSENVGIGGSTITDSNLLNLQGSSASVNIGVVFNDTNTSKIFGIQNGGSSLKFFDYTASTERMRIDSSGNVGIGQTSLGHKLTVNASAFDGIQLQSGGSDCGYLGVNTNTVYVGAGSNLIFHTGNAGLTNGTERMRITSVGAIETNATEAKCLQLNSTHINGPYLSFQESGSAKFYIGKRSAVSGNSGLGYDFYAAGSYGISFYANAGRAMDIATTGNLLVGNTYDAFNARANIYASGSGTSTITLNLWNGGGSGCIYERYVNSGGAAIGSVTQNGASAVSFNTSSDARLKDVTGEARGLEVINELNPVSYNWKEDGKADEGLIAQEVLDIVPNAVSGSEENYYQMDYSKLVVHLVKGMKEQQAQIEALQSEINELKNS